MFIPCALRARIEYCVELDPDMSIGPEEVQVPCEVNFHLQLAIVLRVVVL